MAKCSSCDAEIFFANSATTGALIPFDAEPTPDGTHTIDAARLARPAREYEPLPRYVSHFTTCPNAAAHSKKRPKRSKQLQFGTDE